jgi:hypothetical protein
VHVFGMQRNEASHLIQMTCMPRGAALCACMHVVFLDCSGRFVCAAQRSKSSCIDDAYMARVYAAQRGKSSYIDDLYASGAARIGVLLLEASHLV